MLHSDLHQTRSLTLVLSEEEWRALRDAEPDAVGWLQSQVRQRLSLVREAPKSAPAPAEYSTGDEY